VKRGFLVKALHTQARVPDQSPNHTTTRTP
jgi:hypothetical protein